MIRLMVERRLMPPWFAGEKTAVPMGNDRSLSAADREAVGRARRLIRFLTQPFLVTTQFTGYEGVTVELSDTLSGCHAILEGDADDLDEEDLYMIGPISDARKRPPEANA